MATADRRTDAVMADDMAFHQVEEIADQAPPLLVIPTQHQDGHYRTRRSSRQRSLGSSADLDSDEGFSPYPFYRTVPMVDDAVLFPPTERPRSTASSARPKSANRRPRRLSETRAVARAKAQSKQLATAGGTPTSYAASVAAGASSTGLSGGMSPAGQDVLFFNDGDSVHTTSRAATAARARRRRREPLPVGSPLLARRVSAEMRRLRFEAEVLKNYGRPGSGRASSRAGTGGPTAAAVVVAEVEDVPGKPPPMDLSAIQRGLSGLQLSTERSSVSVLDTPTRTLLAQEKSFVRRYSSESFNKLLRLDLVPQVGDEGAPAAPGNDSSSDGGDNSDDEDDVQVLGTEQSVTRALSTTKSFRSTFMGRAMAQKPHHSSARWGGGSVASHMGSRRRMKPIPSFVHGRASTGGPMGLTLPGVGHGLAADPESRDVHALLAWLEAKLISVNWDGVHPTLRRFIRRPTDSEEKPDPGRGDFSQRTERTDSLSPLRSPPPRGHSRSHSRGLHSVMSSPLVGRTPSSHHMSRQQQSLHSLRSITGASVAAMPLSDGHTSSSPAVVANSVTARLERSRAAAPAMDNVVGIVDYVLSVYHACMDEVRGMLCPMIVNVQLFIGCWFVWLRQLIFQVHNSCAEQGELLAEVLSHQYGELADRYDGSIAASQLHQVESQMSTCLWSAACPATNQLHNRHPCAASRPRIERAA